MSEHKPTGEGDFEEGENIDYKAPPEKSLTEILETDKNDESLTRYKEALLGDAAVSAPVVDPSNPNRVIVKGLALLTEGRPDLYLDLTGNVPTDGRLQLFANIIYLSSID